MPKRTDIHKILVIGSGPIVIRQAAEFDYAGTQACYALREEGYEVILCNSNPATIMTDTTVADKVYMEPLTLEYLSKVIRRERPDAILPGIGGQTGLNLAMELSESGVLEECGTVLLGTSRDSIKRAEDRELFKAMCESIGEPVIPSEITYNLEEAKKAAETIGYPVVLRPAFTLGGTGGGFAADEAELVEIGTNAFRLSPVHQVLIEKSVKGYKEIEYEVIRDANDTAITVCNMENIDPVGIHTGDSIVVCPSQTLTNKEYQMLRDSALKIIRALRIEGGCNVQFALDPLSFKYYLIEVNPRVSRSSALASKASGYPIARVSAKIGVGMTLDEIKLANTPACFEPSLDYIVTKMPRFPFDKFTDAENKLSTQMKATGEVMAIGQTLEESLLKAVRSLEISVNHLRMAKFDEVPDEVLKDEIKECRYDRVFAIAELMRRGVTVDEILESTRMDRFFLDKFRHIVELEKKLADSELTPALLAEVKKYGFSDTEIARVKNTDKYEVFRMRKDAGIMPVYKMIDSCASEFDSYIPYFYSSYDKENESVVSDKKKIVVLGSGPIRIGQGVEFDYSTVHAVKTIKENGFEAIIINNNPETVSTDYTTADKLYFEPLCTEDVMNIIELEKPDGVIATLGGQTAINLADSLSKLGAKLIGSDKEAIDRAENRDLFEKLLKELDIPQPEGSAVTDIEAGVKTAERIGYPVLVRPSFVLGGRAMQIVSKESEMRKYLREAVEISEEKPVLIDKYIRGKEIEVDAICDGTDVLLPGIMELIERTGVHSGDSISVFPAFSLSDKVKATVRDYTRRIGLGVGIIGLYNIQFIVDQDDNVFIIEVNPRSSRTVPFLSKASGIPLADIATKVMLGITLREQGVLKDYAQRKRSYVKVPTFSFAKLHGMDVYLSPEMKSTGEAIGYDSKLHRALYKALIASGIELKDYGDVLFTVADEDKEEALPLAARFAEIGFNIIGTTMTADYLNDHGVKCTKVLNITEGSNEVLERIESGNISYIINTRAILSGNHYINGNLMRKCAVEHGITMFTSLDTVRALMDVLEEMIMPVDIVNEEGI